MRFTTRFMEKCLRFKDKNSDDQPRMSNVVALGAGCFWGTEKYIQKNFQSKFPGSIRSAKVGFMSPRKDDDKEENPAFGQVMPTNSWRVEVVLVELHDPEKHFEELVRFFFQFHDPTTKNQQGNDVGFRYASSIFCGDEHQYRIAANVRQELQLLLNAGELRDRFLETEVTTLVTHLSKFTVAHEWHQRYLEKYPNGYCNHRIRFNEWPKLQAVH